MATQVIATKTDGTQRFSERVVLDGVAFLLELAWNVRDLSWYLHISDANGVLLLVRRIAVGSALTGRFKMLGLPAGEFIAIDTSGKDQDPGLTELGGRVLLTYLPAADLP